MVTVELSRIREPEEEEEEWKIKRMKNFPNVSEIFSKIMKMNTHNFKCSNNDTILIIPNDFYTNIKSYFIKICVLNLFVCISVNLYYIFVLYIYYIYIVFF